MKLRRLRKAQYPRELSAKEVDKWLSLSVLSTHRV